MSKKTVISIDVSDWAEAALRNEEAPQTRDELTDLSLSKGYTATEAARIGMSQRAGGNSPAEILPDDKNLLSDGGAMSVHMMIARAKRTIEIKGQEYEARIATANIQEEEESTDRNYTLLGTEQNCENAKRYLLHRVPGHVWNRLLEIHEGGGDLRDIGKQLIAIIEGFIGKLANGDLKP